jgi:hypothetical protein
MTEHYGPKGSFPIRDNQVRGNTPAARAPVRRIVPFAMIAIVDMCDLNIESLPLIVLKELCDYSAVREECVMN